MPDSYDTIASPAVAELVEKRSRFLAEIRSVSSEAEYAAFVAERKGRYHDARHNCSACVLRAGGVFRYSDDGEPQGTAGMPILEVLRREGLTDVALVVTRYFGGVLLGAGGLVRAYAGSAKRAVDAAQRLRMRLCAVLSVPLPYALYEQVVRLLPPHGAVVVDTEYAESVTLTVRMETGRAGAFQKELSELSGGSVSPALLCEEFAAL